MTHTNHHENRNKYGFYIDRHFYLVKFLTKEKIEYLLNTDITVFSLNLLRDELKFRTAEKVVSKLMFKFFTLKPE